MNSTIVRAPAKVNLYLDVINKRADGYHNIATIFQRLALSDWVKICVIKKGIKVTSDQKGLPTNFNNTAYKAAKSLKDNYRLKCGFKIHLDKRIPHSAGLGGGSSDAAAVLLGINRMLNLGIGKRVLSKIAAKIGADVPFFVSEHAKAYATGIGEQITPMKNGKKRFFLLIKPDIGISTAWVYSSLRNPATLPLTKKRRNANITHSYSRGYIKTNTNSILFNKLEEVVLPSYPVLKTIKKALKQAGAEGILVSGSGSAVFGIFNSRKEAMGAESRLREKGNWQLFLTSSY